MREDERRGRSAIRLRRDALNQIRKERILGKQLKTPRCRIFPKEEKKLIIEQAKRLISLGMRSTRMDDSQTKQEVKKLVKAGLVEAQYAVKLTRAVIREADRERRILSSFLMKEYSTEMKKAAPHAKIATERGRKLARKAIQTAKKLKNITMAKKKTVKKKVKARAKAKPKARKATKAKRKVRRR